MARFRLTSGAKVSMRSIGRYTQKMWGETQRKKYLGTLDKRFRSLALHPGKGRTRDELREELRSYREGHHVIFYLTGKKEIIIIDILHERMEPSLYLGSEI